MSYSETPLPDPQFSLPIEDPSEDPFGPRNQDNVNENRLYNRLGGFSDVKSIKNPSLSLTSGKSIFNFLDLKTEVSTTELLKDHFLRIVLTFFIFLHMQVIDLIENIKNLVEMYNQFKLVLTVEAKLKALNSSYSIAFIKKAIESSRYVYNLIEGSPRIAYKVIIQNVYHYVPSGLEQFRNSIPSESLPESTGLLLQINNNLVSPPPEVPQPYLDGGEKIKVPRVKEIQNVLALRNEYFTQQRAHIAAEKVRMLSEIGRFVTWNCLIPSIRFINVYERFGILWDSNKSSVTEKLEILGHSILNELNSLMNTFKNEEIDRVNNLIPKIILIDVATNTRYILNDSTENAIETGSIEDLISSYGDKRELLIYLSDNRMREEFLINFAIKSLNHAENIEETAKHYLPPTPDLIIIPSKNSRNPLKTYGFISSDRNDRESKTSIIYSKRLRFGYNLFSKSLFYYSLNNDKEPIQIEFDNSNSTSSRSLFSYVNSQSSHFLTRFFDSLNKFKIFNNKTSDQKSNQIENDQIKDGQAEDVQNENDQLEEAATY